MEQYRTLLESFVRRSRDILGDNLTGIYLHGSAAMGCFQAKKSDLDLLIVVKNSLSGQEKRRYMDMVVELNGQAPAKGLELSVIREAVCRPFVYPTPYELHFSIMYLDWYRSDPEDYLEKMKGTDRDLAAHVTVTWHRGRTLYGKEIREVFSSVRGEDYFDSIWSDVENAEEEIGENPVYVILNLCRVLAYQEEHTVLSKREGGAWGLEQLPEKYAALIGDALEEYRTGEAKKFDRQLAREFAKAMLERIRSGRGC